MVVSVFRSENCGSWWCSWCVAGVLLALLTVSNFSFLEHQGCLEADFDKPKLWASSPSAIIPIYGPTDMHNIPYQAKGPLAALDIAVLSSDEIRLATSFDHPPPNTPLPVGGEWLNGRTKTGLSMFRIEITAELLLRVLTRSKVEGLPDEFSFPRLGDVTREEIDEISE